MIPQRTLLRSQDAAVSLLGEPDALLKTMERDFGVEMLLRQDAASGELALSLKGAAGRVGKAQRRLQERLEHIRRAQAAPEDAPLGGALEAEPLSLPENGLYRSAFGKIVSPRTKNQQKYVDAIRSHDLTFGIGPAGTGKTFLAVACALRALAAREVHRVILTRPVVEAGERLGFLPGDLLEKVNPYLKPLYDAFYILLVPQQFRAWRDNEVIEVVPLAYMRGRTFDDSFIVLDEAQNTTPEQMKMFLTRMGVGSRMVVTGDITQTDLEPKVTSGLIRIMDVLEGTPGVSFNNLTEEDVVRHPMVRRIIRAYAQWEKRI